MIGSSRIVLAALALSVAAVLVALGVAAYAAVSNASRVEDVRQLVTDVQTSRFDATVRSCEARSADHAEIVRFVARLNPRLRAPASRAFPPIADDCRAYARATTRIH